MFGSNSRYANLPSAEVANGKGKKVTVVRLRRLPFVTGNLTEVKGTDRLDIMAHRKFKDGTKFWRIADANTELEANDLVEHETPENPLVRNETAFIIVPEN